MAGGQRSFILFIILAVVAACGRTPLEDQLPNPQPKQSTGPINHGSIKVTLYTNSLANGNGQVDLLLPDGSKRSQGASPSCVFSGLTQGGIYTARYQNQPSAAPAGVTVTLSAISPTAAVCLQSGGASLVISPVAGQPQGYAFDATTFYYDVQFIPASGATADVQLDIQPGGLPFGWTYAFNPTFLRGASRGTLAVTSAVGCTSTSVAFVARAMVGGAEMASAGLTVARAWSLGASARWVQTLNMSNNNLTKYELEMQYMVQVTGSGIAAGLPVSIQATNCPSAMGMDLETTPSFANDAWGSLCGPVTLMVNDAPRSLVIHSLSTDQTFNFTITLCGYSTSFQIAGHP